MLYRPNILPVLRKIPASNIGMLISSTEQAFGKDVWKRIDETMLYLIMKNFFSFFIYQDKESQLNISQDFEKEKYLLPENSSVAKLASYGDAVLTNGYMNYPWPNAVLTNYPNYYELLSEIEESSIRPGTVVIVNDTKGDKDEFYECDVLEADAWNEIITFLNEQGKLGWNLITVSEAKFLVTDLPYLWDSEENNLHVVNPDGIIPAYIPIIKGWTSEVLCPTLDRTVAHIEAEKIIYDAIQNKSLMAGGII